MMNRIKRWTTSLVASFDSMISQVENHEALVNAAIREVQDSGARAKVQLSKVKQDGQQMRKKLIELRSQDDLWKTRALRTATLDEARAVQCLKRKKRFEKEIGELEEQEREHAKLERQLCTDLNMIDNKLTRLKQQRNLLRTRQSRAEALRSLQLDDSNIISEIDDIFERWEMKVGEYEARSSGIGVSEDDLEQEFSSEEELRELKQELQELLQEQPDLNEVATIQKSSN